MDARGRLNIGQLIKTVFDESDLTVAEFARRIHCERTNVYSIFERCSIDVKLLVDISFALNHNFLDDVMLQCGLKSPLCPRQAHIYLNLDGLPDNRVKQIADFLNEFSKEKQ